MRTTGLFLASKGKIFFLNKPTEKKTNTFFLKQALTHISLKVECLVVQQGLNHPHEVNEENQVLLHHVDLHTLRNKQD